MIQELAYYTNPLGIDSQGGENTPPEIMEQMTREAVEEAGLTKALYVEREVAATKARMDAGLLEEYVDPRDGRRRLDRARDYANWRWEGYHTLLDGTRLPDRTFTRDLDKKRQVASL